MVYDFAASVSFSEEAEQETQTSQLVGSELDEP